MTQNSCLEEILLAKNQGNKLHGVHNDLDLLLTGFWTLVDGSARAKRE
jgi:hypothetical protein